MVRRGRGIDPHKVSGAGPNYKRPSSTAESEGLLRDKSGTIDATITIIRFGKESRICELSIRQSNSLNSERSFEKACKILLKGLFIAKATIHFVGQALDQNNSRIDIPIPINYRLPIMPPKYPATKEILGLLKELETTNNNASDSVRKNAQVQFTLPRSIQLDYFLGEVLVPGGQFRAD